MEHDFSTSSSPSLTSPSGHRSGSSRKRVSQFSLNPPGNIREIGQTDHKANSRVQELTINKLRFDDVKFVGRKVESNILKCCLHRMMATKSNDGGQPDNNQASAYEAMAGGGNKEVVLIKGFSGCGKSALASQLNDWTSETENGLVARGKFELTTTRPYSGVAQALAVICNRLNQDIQVDIESKKAMGAHLISELGSTMHQVVSLIPELRSILPDGYEEQISGRFEEDENFDAEQQQWMHAFRVLIRAFGTCFSPLVLVLDDLQWAGMASLAVIEALVSDTQNTRALMVVGCYRSNEVDHAHELTRMISTLEEKTEKGTLKLTEIELGNISLEDANKMVMALLGIDDEEIAKALTQVCFKRTLGNPFFLIEFVTMLEGEGLVSFNLGLLKWVWDVEKVEQGTMSTNNVVYLLVARMKKLPDDIQLVLQYAANLGDSFNENLLQQIWSLHSSNEDSNRKGYDLQKAFYILQSDHYIEKTSNGDYQWVHDKVQEAALTLGKANNPDFQLEIGTILYQELSADELELSLFDVVNLINRGRAQRSSLFSQLNLRAARKARSLSAFDISARYCSCGVDLLQDEKWSSMNRELTLSLVVLGCEMELATANITGMERYAGQVLPRNDCSTLEKLPVYFAMAHKHEMDMQYKKASELYLLVLKDLGYSFPRSKALMAVLGFKDVLKISRTSRKNKVDYNSLSLVTDERQKAIMTVLSRIFYAAYMSEDAPLMIFSTTRNYAMTLEHGISEESGGSFAFVSNVISAALKDYDSAIYFLHAAKKVQEKAPSRYHETMVGMWAMWALLAYASMMPLYLGKPLRGALEEASRCIPLMEDLNQINQTITCQLVCQTMSNLAGESAQTVELQGNYIDTVGWVPPTNIIEVDMKGQCLILLNFFGQYEKAADLAFAIGGKYAKLLPGYYFCQFEAFMRGVPLIAMFRRTRKRKYKRAAQGILRMIDGWVKKGNPNVVQFAYLLKAELAASKQKDVEAESLYNDAIVISGRTGQLHIAGLANERYADYLLVDRKDKEGAKYRFEQALRFYSEWGALAVVERLRNDMAKLDLK